MLFLTFGVCGGGQGGRWAGGGRAWGGGGRGKGEADNLDPKDKDVFKAAASAPVKRGGKRA